MNKKIRNDILLFALCVLLSAGGFFLASAREKGKTVQIFADGKLVGEYLLSIPREISVSAKNGALTVVIADGQAYVTAATCKDKLCEKCGKIDKAGASIVCLPSGITVTVPAEEVDAYVG